MRLRSRRIRRIMDISRGRLHLHMFSSAALCFPNKSSSRMQNRPFIFKILYLGRARSRAEGLIYSASIPPATNPNDAPSLALTSPPSNTRPLIILPFPRCNFFLLDFQSGENKVSHGAISEDVCITRIYFSRARAFTSKSGGKIEEAKPR